MQESFTPEHSSELFGDPLEQFLDGSGVSNECGGHLKTPGRNVTNGSLDIVGDPLDKVGAVLVLHVEHLLVDLLHGHAASEQCSHGEVAAMTRIAGSHHVLGVEHLLRQLGHRESTVLLAATAGERRKAWHEEVQTREGHHVDSELAQIRVELTREAQAGRHTGHGGANEMVEIAIGGSCELECAEADVVEGLVVNAVGLVGVLNELMN